MKILILGAGQTGGTLAEHLAEEHADVTLVDQDAARLQSLRDRLDIRTVHGHASLPDTLLAAGASDADMLIAVTSSDEVNMVACQVCYSLFKTPKKIARIRSREYGSSSNEFFRSDHMPIDTLINPEQVVMEQIKQLLEHPGALEVLDFADGRVQLVAMRAYRGGPLVGQKLRSLRERVPNVDTKVVAIFRAGAPVTPEADTIIQEDDEVFFVAPARHIETVMSELRQTERPNKRVMIAGGGNIGLLLASAIDKEFRVKLIEFGAERAGFVSERLADTVCIHGDATDRELLEGLNIEDFDAFCAVTNEDEVNVMSALLAKRLGARRVLSLIAKPAYVDLVQGSDIDIAVSPQLATISTILSLVRRGDVQRVHSLRRGAAEAFETVVHGNRRSSRVAGYRLDEIALPPGVTIGAIVRSEQVIVAREDTVLEEEDHVILFIVDKHQTPKVERLFQVSPVSW